MHELHETLGLSETKGWGYFPFLNTPRSVILRKAPRLDAKPRHHRPCNLRGVTPEHPKATSWHLNSSLCRRLEQIDLPVSYTTTATQTNVHSETTSFFLLTTDIPLGTQGTVWTILRCRSSIRTRRASAPQALLHVSPRPGSHLPQPAGDLEGCDGLYRQRSGSNFKRDLRRSRGNSSQCWLARRQR